MTANRNVNPSLLSLATSTSAIDAINKGLIHCGFELEFQKIDGKDKNSCDGNEIDWEAVSEYIDENMDDSDIIDCMDSPFDDLAKAVIEQMGCRLYMVESYLAGPLKKAFNSEFESSESTARENYQEGLDLSDFYESSDETEMYEDVNLPKEFESLVDLGEDGSVNGGEIRTLGPLTPGKFMAIATYILDNHEFEVDAGCSFHIHLSVPGVQHTYGKRFQAELMAYLLENIKSMPSDVQKRLKSNKCPEYFDFKVSEEKYTAVSYRGNTWEFRLFGSIDCKQQARRCLILAIDAMRHAYQVKLGLKTSLLGEVESDSIREMSKAVVKQGKTFKAARKEVTTTQNRAG